MPNVGAVQGKTIQVHFREHQGQLFAVQAHAAQQWSTLASRIDTSKLASFDNAPIGGNGVQVHYNPVNLEGFAADSVLHINRAEAVSFIAQHGDALEAATQGDKLYEF